MAPYQYVYVMKDLTKSYPGGREVFKGITLSFLPGVKIGVLGVNGAGKSTLLKIMAGIDKEYGGEAWAADGVKVGYLEQEPQLDPKLTVGENVALGFGDLKKAVDRFNEISMRFAEPMEDDEMNALLAEQAELQEKIDAGDGWELDRKLEIALDALRCPPADSPVDKLSGGERRRVALCRLLIEKPDILLLDEPTNHLDAESVAWLERTLRDYQGTVMVITHDRYFLDNVTNWILEIERGRGIPFEGNYSSWLEQKRKRLAQEEKEESARQRALAAEQEWIGSSPKARQAKSKSRIARYEEMLAQSAEKQNTVADIVIAPGPRLGGTVIEADHLTKGFGDRLLIDDLSFKLPPGGIVGVIGPNGAGKSTLFKMIVGAEKPDSGELKIGETVKLGYVDQSRDDLDPNKTVWEEISGGTDVIYLGKRAVPSRAYVGAFNFKGSDQQKKVGILSGGERNRVHLAKMLRQESNVLLLDEPTNDLDVDTLRALEEALAEFPGCAVVITHDRWFLDRLATHILAFEGDSHVEWFEGNFEAYEEDKRRRLGADATEPGRIRYRPIAR
ncbi:energy-dependent translational throttle protein EttA [Acetobacter indonesiensis]|jgi:ATP-binding cassette ChvD family protein|uniref:Energy-dependent translational throttle protein EttA n=2 Tax=Acetobacter indonesiensis TaxID=104101 RepID=A0A252ATR4_9PROT|nr:energy-dependent translational throttle protein EttA [Acetobacter indonesiensis]MCG0995242.1 energy-dependent translational throttle protein EttA [Acetobacter indonesiensis]MCI1438148.1 energy-dependent translational throttle protein EttA [Acetobacter indonesiensis]MCI1546730.1 energy-dependent translational throttle protein EttA [Acetobacter indonesiensis]MCI1766082.1 energy-dependent translational throttle protein EttA [Acetobacter indonesiensis]MCP1231343.1 energy-dependent translational